MQQRYALIILLASVLFAGGTIFSLCLMQPKREHQAPSKAKYGFDAYDALAGLPIRRRSGGSVIPPMAMMQTVSEPSAGKRSTEFERQLAACHSYPTVLCHAAVVYTQCLVFNAATESDVDRRRCLEAAFGRSTVRYPHDLADDENEDQDQSQDESEESRLKRVSGFQDGPLIPTVDVKAAEDSAKRAGLAPGFLIDGLPRDR